MLLHKIRDIAYSIGDSSRYNYLEIPHRELNKANLARWQYIVSLGNLELNAAFR